MNKNKTLAIVFDSPTTYDLIRGDIIRGEQYELLKRLVEFAGFSMDNTYLTFSVKEKLEGKLTPELIEENHVALMDELEAVKPSKILAMGGTALSILRNAPKALAISKEHSLGELITIGEQKCYMTATYPLWWVYKDADIFRDVVKTFTKLKERTAPLQTPEIEYFIPDTIEQLASAMDYFATLPVVSIDLETTGFNPRRDTITAIGFGYCEELDLSKQRQQGVALIIPEPLIYNPITQKMVSDFMSMRTHTGKKVFHNAIFDLQFLSYYTGESYLDTDIDDTILISYLTDERSIGGECGKGISPHGLKTLSRVYFDQADYHFDFPTWIKQPHDERDYDALYKYLCYDLLYTSQLYYILSREVDAEDKDLWNVYNTLLIPATKTFAEIQLQGAPIDRIYLTELARQYEGDPIYNEDEEIVGYTGGKIQEVQAKIKEIIAEMGCPDDFVENFNPNSSQQIGKVLYDFMGVPKIKAKKKKSKTDKPVDKGMLEEFVNLYSGTIVDKFIQLIKENRAYTKILSTYIHGLLNSSEDDGNAHGTFKVIGTVTGRVSSSNPNLQNIPSRGSFKKAIKKAFIAPEGYTFISVDLSQVEYRMVADLSNDEKMLDVYNTGIDLHSYVGSLVLNKPIEDVTKDERDISKQLGFSVLYGSSSASLSEQLTRKLGDSWTIKKVDNTLKAFLNQFDKLSDWISSQKEFASKNQYIKHSIGRYRRFPFIHAKNINEVHRQAVNTAPQSIASDLVVYSAINLHKSLKSLGGSIVSLVHDNINCIVPTENTNKALDLIMDEMTKNTLIPLNVKMEADAAIGQNWGEVESVKL